MLTVVSAPAAVAVAAPMLKATPEQLKFVRSLSEPQFVLLAITNAESEMADALTHVAKLAVMARFKIDVMAVEGIEVADKLIGLLWPELMLASTFTTEYLNAAA